MGAGKHALRKRNERKRKDWKDLRQHYLDQPWLARLQLLEGAGDQVSCPPRTRELRGGEGPEGTPCWTEAWPGDPHRSTRPQLPPSAPPPWLKTRLCPQGSPREPWSKAALWIAEMTMLCNITIQVLIYHNVIHPSLTALAARLSDTDDKLWSLRRITGSSMIVRWMISILVRTKENRSRGL